MYENRKLLVFVIWCAYVSPPKAWLACGTPAHVSRTRGQAGKWERLAKTAESQDARERRLGVFECMFRIAAIRPERGKPVGLIWG